MDFFFVKHKYKVKAYVRLMKNRGAVKVGKNSVGIFGCTPFEFYTLCILPEYDAI
jgi:hypothetical protein